MAQTLVVVSFKESPFSPWGASLARGSLSPCPGATPGCILHGCPLKGSCKTCHLATNDSRLPATPRCGCRVCACAHGTRISVLSVDQSKRLVALVQWTCRPVNVGYSVEVFSPLSWLMVQGREGWRSQDDLTWRRYIYRSVGWSAEYKSNFPHRYSLSL